MNGKRTFCHTWKDAIRFAFATRRGQLVISGGGIPKASELDDADVIEIFESMSALINVVGEKEHQLKCAQQERADIDERMNEVQEALDTLRACLAQTKILTPAIDDEPDYNETPEEEADRLTGCEA